MADHQLLDGGLKGVKPDLAFLSIVLLEFDNGDIFIKLFKDSLFELPLVFVGLDYREIFVIIHNEIEIAQKTTKFK